jgi:hypothetical protein
MRSTGYGYINGCRKRTTRKHGDSFTEGSAGLVRREVVWENGGGAVASDELCS